VGLLNQLLAVMWRIRVAMSKLYAEGLHKKLKPVYREFDACCKDHNLFYSIDNDTSIEQGYLIKSQDTDVDPIIHRMHDFIYDKMVFMDVDKNRRDGVLVSFKVKNIEEDQYKNPTGTHRRRQSARPSSFNKSPSFGGVTK